MAKQRHNHSVQFRTLLEHMARYRMTVGEAIVRTARIPRASNTATKRQMRQLVESGCAAVAPLYRNRRYLYLTEKGAEQVAKLTKQDRHAGYGPLSELAKIRAYAHLAFCCLQETPRERLTVADFQSYFPDLYQPGMAMNYYIESVAGKLRLGFLRVDVGGRGRWDRVIQKIRNDVESHWLHVGFRRLIEQGVFEITIATTLKQKADRICSALSDHRDANRAPIKVVAIPELIHLIAPPAIQNQPQAMTPPEAV